jgi:hypothetical protein
MSLSTNNPSLLDILKLTDPDGKGAAVVEILNEYNTIVADAVTTVANGDHYHRSSVRTGLPNSTWRAMYQFVQPSKSTYAQIQDNIGNLEAYSEPDKDLIDLAPGGKEHALLMESRGHLESMAQNLANTMIYGSEQIEPNSFTGLAPRYSSLSAENADNILVGGGAGTDNASIWFVKWAETTCHLIVPKGNATDAIMVNFKGQDTLTGTGGSREIYRTHFKVNLGLHLRDWRGVGRICNIDKSDLNATATGSSANLPRLMRQLLSRIDNPYSGGRGVWYMSRDMKDILEAQIENRVANSTLTIENVGGVPTTMFAGFPIHRLDCLSADEALVS